MAYGGEWVNCVKADNAFERFVSDESGITICWELEENLEYPDNEHNFEYLMITGERKCQADMADTDVRLLVQEWEENTKYSPIDIWDIKLSAAEKLTNILRGIRND